ncbi:lipase/acyltransferase domain-containing protein, partial [Streptomyces fulvoviolaceus]|uniref:lipase/acyltransferase domain-containing protein n=1 Tax=Streptomyces fulvoviolaceus TaxID=285535 RepID=UPI0021BEBDD5
TTLRTPDGLVWSPSAGALLTAIKTFGRSLTRLQLPEGIKDEHPNDGVHPVALMPDLHALPGVWPAVKGYDLLLERLRSLGYRESSPAPDAPPGSLLPAPYDWRLSNRWNGRHLATLVEPALERWRAQGGPYADAQLVFVCHSMGGLVARWYIEQCGGAEFTRKLITFGTPYRGAAKALEQLVNGVRKRIGPLSVDLTAFARSLPSLHQLLPEYACIEPTAPGPLAKTTEIDIPDLDTKQATDAMRFHTQLRDAETARPASLTATHALVGIRQNTPTTARITRTGVEILGTYETRNLFGDGTVPIVGASRHDVPLDSNTLRRIPDQHGNLHRNPAALDELEGILTAADIVVRAPETTHLSVDVPELITVDEDLTVQVATANNKRTAVRLTISNEAGRLEQARVVTAGPEPVEATFDGLAPGAYTVDATGASPASRIAPVSSDILIWD